MDLQPEAKQDKYQHDEPDQSAILIVKLGHDVVLAIGAAKADWDITKVHTCDHYLQNTSKRYERRSGGNA